MLFSIIIPVHNSGNCIHSCLQSIYSSISDKSDIEVIIVDDCSTGQSCHQLRSLATSNPGIRLLRTKRNSGPGIARNLGLRNAAGKWILFLDSDDLYPEHALENLKSFLSSPKINITDMVIFNWTYSKKSTVKPVTQFTGRVDSQYLALPKKEILRNYLALKMDNSVIYSAFKKSLLIENRIYFRGGVHEDVDYMFMAYYHAKHVLFYDRVLYLKTSRKKSIINTISERHLVGFVQAYKTIEDFLFRKGKRSTAFWKSDFAAGLIGLVATRAREIVRFCKKPVLRASLYRCLYNEFMKTFPQDLEKVLRKTRTLYGEITKTFLHTMSSDETPARKEMLITKFLCENMNKRFSCDDLHHSLFLAANEVRACCKRFFIGSHMKGDALLCRIPGTSSSEQNIENILAARTMLFSSINKGETTDCSECPFMRFQEWGPIQKATISKISLEQQTICNLKCSYCSDKYYGGSRATYSAEELLHGLINRDMIDPKATIIWGGGEPLLLSNFDDMIYTLIGLLPESSHRVLTNCVKYSTRLQELLKKESVHIYTSIDAGSRETYKAIRGADCFFQTLKNIARYSTADPGRITVKYVFTDGNSTRDEIHGLVNYLSEYNLFKCNFQISLDFKKHRITPEEMALVIELHSLLKEKGCEVVVVDEMIRQRTRLENRDSFINRIAELMGKDEYLNRVADIKSYRSVAVWGAGEQAKNLLEHTLFFRSVEIEYFVDSTPSKIGTTYMGYNVLEPRTLIDSDLPVIIAAVQNYHLIYKAFVDLGIDKSRLIERFII